MVSRKVGGPTIQTRCTFRANALALGTELLKYDILKWTQDGTPRRDCSWRETGLQPLWRSGRPSWDRSATSTGNQTRL